MILVLGNDKGNGWDMYGACTYMTMMLMMTNTSKITIDVSTLHVCAVIVISIFFVVRHCLCVHFAVPTCGLKMIDNCTGLTSIQSKWCDRRRDTIYAHTTVVIRKANKMVR